MDAKVLKLELFIHYCMRVFVASLEWITRETFEFLWSQITLTLIESLFFFFYRALHRGNTITLSWFYVSVIKGVSFYRTPGIKILRPYVTSYTSQTLISPRTQSNSSIGSVWSLMIQETFCTHNATPRIWDLGRVFIFDPMIPVAWHGHDM